MTKPDPRFNHQQTTGCLLGGIVLILLVPLGLVLAYIWQAGLDLRTADSVRQYLDLCSRGHEDIVCKAMRIEARGHREPLTLLRPGSRGDREATTALSAYLAQHGLPSSALVTDPQVRRRFFEAHAFALPGLTTGVHTTLSGQSYRVKCHEKSDVCEFGEFRVWNYFQRPPADGSLYTLAARVVGPDEQIFLPFLPDQP